MFTRGSEPVLDFRDAWEKVTTGTKCRCLLSHDLRRSAVRNMVRAGSPSGLYENFGP